MNSTTLERDTTVSDMRQEIERLNLLQSDQTQLVNQVKENEKSLKQKSETFSTNLQNLEKERNQLHTKLEMMNIENNELQRQLQNLRNPSDSVTPEFENQMIQLQSHNQVLINKMEELHDVVESLKTQIGFMEGDKQAKMKEYAELNNQNQQNIG